MLFEQTIYFIQNFEELDEFERKLENEEIKDNSLVMFENINFFMEECGVEIDEWHGQEAILKLFNKIKFTSNLSRGSYFVNDSQRSIMRTYPTVIDMQCDKKCLGLRLENQFSKIFNFFSINTKEYILIIGGENDVLTDLRIINATLLKFKSVFIIGKLAIYFITFIQKKFNFGNEEFTSEYNRLTRFILIQAHLNKIEVVLPEDATILDVSEYEKFLTEENYLKKIKSLFKRQKAAAELENQIKDIDELNENPGKSHPLLLMDNTLYLKYNISLLAYGPGLLAYNI